MRKALVIIATTALMAGIASVALAKVPDSSGVIHACRATKSGALRAIDSDAGQTCTKDEAGLNWNQTGPQGLAGAPGLSNIEVVSTHYRNACQPTPSGSCSYDPIQSETTVLCPAGKTAISEGHLVAPNANGQARFIQANDTVGVGPLLDADGKPIGAVLQMGDFTGTTPEVDVYLYVTCATTT